MQQLVVAGLLQRPQQVGLAGLPFVVLEVGALEQHLGTAGPGGIVATSRSARASALLTSPATARFSISVIARRRTASESSGGVRRTP